MSCPRCNAPAEEQTLREFGGVCPKCLLAFSEEQDAPAFPNLEIVEMIGQGGMGVVYKARQKNLDRVVALKVLSPQLSDDPEFVERFTREAKALAQLSHPNIVAIHDSGIHDRVPYLVMEYIDGHPLRSLLASGKITPARALEFIPQIYDALQYAHAHGVVHRDIKPENILIDLQGRVKIADFGLAKLSKIGETQITQSGYVMGTPRYMAPEQFQPSGKVDHRADIYSLGVVFYEMLTGEVPMGRFKPPSAKADVDRRLDPVVLKSLEREPEDRYQSANEVKEQVAGLKSRPAAQVGPRPPHPLRKSALLIALLGLAALLPGTVFGLLELPVAKIFLTVGGALLMASLVAWALSFAFRPDPAPAEERLRLERLQIGGCLLFLIIGGLLCLALMAFLFYSSSPPQLPPPRTPPPAGSVASGFRLEDAWPSVEALPRDLEARPVDSKKAMEDLGVDPAAMNSIKEIRRWGIVVRNDKTSGGHRCFVTGIQFESSSERIRWQKTIRKANASSDYSAGASMLWVEFDHSQGIGAVYSPLTSLLYENVRAAKEREALRQPRNR